MPQLQLAFTKKIELKNQLWIKKSELKKLLEDNHQYTTAAEEIKTLKYQQKEILNGILQAFPQLAEEIEQVMAELRDQDEMVSDLAIKDYLERKDITIPDPKRDDVQWVPTLQIKYRREKKEIKKDK